MIQSHKKSIFEILGRRPVHPFPARMAPGIALEAVTGSNKPLRVLDPMMGSGTVLAVARSKGHRAIGVDIDPLAVLISKIWTSAIDVEGVQQKASEVLVRARRIFTTLSTCDAYPQNSDLETQKFIRYWFDNYARRQLASLAIAISRVRNNTIRDALWCGFSRLIIAKQSGASLAMDLSHSRPHKVFDHAPIKPFRKFLDAVDQVVNHCIDNKCSGRGPATRTYEGDARALPLQDSSIDLVLTSPPYLNAIDYIRCSKFSLVWMGYKISGLRNVRSISVGTEIGKIALHDDHEIHNIISHLKLKPRLNARDEGILIRYIDDMRNALRETTRVLAPGGKAVYVIGENTIRGTYIRNSLIVSKTAELLGLHLDERRVRTLPANRRYLPPPTKGTSANSLDSRMRREVVLAFSKPSKLAVRVNT